MDEELDLVGSTEAAEIAGTTRQTIQRWAESGRLETVLQLPGSRGALLFRRADVEAERDAQREARA